MIDNNVYVNTYFRVEAGYHGDDGLPIGGGAVFFLIDIARDRPYIISLVTLIKCQF